MSNGIKFLLGIVLVIGLLFAFLFLSAPETSERSTERTEHPAEEQEENEVSPPQTAGETPEESVTGFIAALRAGDIDTALIFIAPEHRDAWAIDLARIEELGILDVAADELASATRTTSSEEGQVMFAVYDGEGEIATAIVLERASDGYWYILSF